MRQFLAAALTTLVLAAPAAAQSLDVPSGTYVSDPTHTSVVWKLSHFGYSTYTGNFERKAIAATVELDADDVANSSVEVTLNGNAVRTLHPGPTDFDAEIASDMFLNAVAHPEITFKSTGITLTGDNTADVAGELTVNGQTHPFTLAATLNRAATHPMSGNPTIGISAVGTLDRTEYGVTSLAGPIGTEVTIEVQAEFIPE
ncbi:YceI family protein [Acuticoccus mangrovi]|uniref:Polyisoprenoid-binding protein n=1 Tax=Acuticoccus mangrovi TaxID=2796142 RepID=A0A934IEE3_9HYPH|nr:YceI family protein [Acuticoccus mangrovi]MBJ3775008.1 polyisoprenoid-binding protein [Acuticoccus mangrovi]